MATDIAIPKVATFASLQQDDIKKLISAPTKELVHKLLVSISKKTKEFEESASTRLKLRVELENANKAHDAKVKLMKNSVDKANEENKKLREQLKTAEALKHSATAELELVKSSFTSSESESNTLRTRIAALESSQRDSAALLDKKSAAYDELANELSEKHKKTVELRKELSTLEQNVSALGSKSSSWRIQEQELQQEAEALRTHNEWLDQELKTRNAEHSKFRKDKNARLSEVQQQLEDATSNIESLKRTEQTLRTRLQEVTQKSEDYLQQIQTLRADLARDADNHKTELDTEIRLGQLLQESLDTEKRRVQDLTEELEERQAGAAEEISRINLEVEEEHEERLKAERHVQELEVEIERLTSDLQTNKRQESILHTPRAKVNGSNIGTPRNGSPMPSSRGGLNYTQLVSDFHIAKSELEAERRRTSELSEQLEEVMRDLELRQPEVERLQADHDRLENDVVQLTALLDAASQDRDNANKHSRKLERDVNGLNREADLLRQQLRDLSSQIKILLLEVHRKNSGAGDFTAEQRSALEALAQGDLDNEDASAVSDTHRFISENLTTFKKIEDLQENNAKLLRLTRDLGERMEGEEAEQEKAQARQNHDDLVDLRSRYEKAKDEIRILTTQSNSFIKERDMFRRMLSHRGKLPPGDLAANFGDSINGSMPATPARRDSIAPGSPSSRELVDLTKAIKELQGQYDSYKNEAGQHQTLLKQQTDTLSQQNADLRNEVSKKTNEATLASDRYEMLQGNFGMLKTENQELQKRSQSLSERVSKQEIRTQQVAEDLVEAKGLAESLRNEAANLKAEKEFWKTVEKRLNDEITSLGTERDRLNGLNTNLQSIINDKEHTETETRNRLQTQVESLEADLQSARQKLNDEIAENKRQTFRREYETQQNSARVEELMTTLATVREESVAAKTSKDHLQTRVEELIIELRNAQDTLEVYRPKPVDESQQSKDTGVTKEQELELQVTELKRELDLTKRELAESKTLIEQLKTISQNAEEEQQSIADTYDQYRQDTDSQLEERSTKIATLEETIQNLRSEIQSINAELLASTERGSEHSQQMQTQKTTFEAEIAQLRDSIERSQAAVQYHQEDLRKQAEIAAQAQQNYDTELLKHADATRNLQTIRAELSQIKLESVEYRTAAESAETRLQQNEESWKETKERYERELSEIRSRRDDAAAQNELLHAQLESLNKNIGEMRHKRTSDIGVASSDGDAGVQTQNLNELVKYLQKEKTIVDTQYLRAQQESKRLQQQLDHTKTQLDDVRIKLAQEQKSNENTERQTLNHNKLMETLQELNLYRESNTTLRLEKQQVETTLSERSALVEQMQGQILPLQSKIAELEESKDMLETDVRLATEAKERFEKRYLDILNRSNAVDPAEFEAAKQKLSELETQRDELVAAKAALQQEIDGHPAKIQAELDVLKSQNEDRFTKVREQAKEKNRTQVAAIKEKDTALQTALKEKDDLLAQLQSAQTELESAIASKNQAESFLAAASESASTKASADTQALSAEIASLKTQLAQAETNVQTESQKSEQLAEELQTTQQNVSGFSSEIESLNESLNQANTQVADLTTRLQDTSARTDNNQALSTLQESLDSANAQIAELQTKLKDAPVATSTEGDEDEVIAKLHDQIRQLEAEADNLRTQLQVSEAAKEVSEEGTVSVAEQIASQIEPLRQELIQKHEARIKAEEERFKTRADKMKTALNNQITKLKDGKSASATGPSQEALDEITKAHQQEIEALNARHATEIEELQKNAKNATENTPPALADLEPTEDEIRVFLKNNPFARKAVKNSIDNQIKRVTDEEQGKAEDAIKKSQEDSAQNLKVELERVRAEEQNKLQEQLKDVEARITKAKEDAEMMTTKKFNVKFSMAENRMNMAMAKVGYVQKAAEENPQQAVGKVWEIAKDQKPPPKLPPPTQPSTTSSTPLPAANLAATAVALANNQNSALPSQTQPPTNLFMQKGGIQGSSFGKPSGQPYQNRQSTFGQPSGQTPGMAALGIAPPPTAPATGLAQSQHARGNRGASGIPRGGSSIPRGGRVSSIPRGGGAIGNRGGQGLDGANDPPSASTESPNTPLNAQAAQFIPGQKRSIDEDAVSSEEKRTKTAE